jgi:hypothetical protein
MFAITARDDWFRHHAQLLWEFTVVFNCMQSSRNASEHRSAKRLSEVVPLEVAD